MRTPSETPSPGESRGRGLIFDRAEPECLTIIPTYRCNAACSECCFESNPSIRHRMTRDELLATIEKAHSEFPGLRYIVLTGGEVTLLRNDLIDAIRLLTNLGLGSRIVSNGHWGRTTESAIGWVTSLRQAGLCELNLSTGDEHQAWVPFESVARAAYHAVEQGLTTVIVVEGQDNAEFTLDSVTASPDIQRIYANAELRQRFVLMSNIWMPFHDGAQYTTDRGETSSEGCDNVFENFVVNPYGHLLSCCGLTMEHIPELKVGDVYRESMGAVYRRQFSDLLKMWIWLDGTRHIFDQLASRYGLSLISAHPCSICAQLYRTSDIRDALVELVRSHEDNIVFRAAVKASLRAPAADRTAVPSEAR